MSIEVKTIYGPNTNISKNGIQEVQDNLNISKEIQNSEEKTTEIFRPRLRYFAVGPKTDYIIKCPLCDVRNETHTALPINLKNTIFQYLSCFSFCIPILWIPFGLLCISAWTKRKRQFCSNCGAQMGFYYRPS